VMGEEDSGARRDSPTASAAAPPRHRILYLAPFTPRSDAMHGGGRILAQLLLRLARRNRVGLVYLRGPGTTPIEPALEEACELVQEIVPRRRRDAGGKQHRIDVLRAPLTGLPSPAAAVHDRSLTHSADDAVLGWTPDIVQVEQDVLAYLGPVVRRTSSDAKLILTCHEPGPAAAADLVRTTHGRQRLAHSVDRRAWQRYWSRTLGAFDVVVTFTDRDRSVVTAANPSVRAVAIPFGIDIPDTPLSAVGGDEPRVFFVGGYMHPPNSDAALRLLRSIMPAVRRRLPGLRLILAGADPGPEMLSAAGPDDLITGTVERVEPHLDAAALLALPIRMGGGMRVKLLEALAAGKAVVASPLAAAGVDVTDGTELALADSDEEFAATITRLLQDADARGRLGTAARAWAVRELSWDPRVRQYTALYSRLLAG